MKKFYRRLVWGLCLGITAAALGAAVFLLKGRVNRFNETALAEIKARKTDVLYREFYPGLTGEYAYEDLEQGKVSAEVLEKDRMIAFYDAFRSDSAYVTWFDVGVSAVLVYRGNEVKEYPAEFLWINDSELGDCYVPVEEKTASEITAYLQNYVAKDSTCKKQQYIISTDFEFRCAGRELLCKQEFARKNIAFLSSLVLINNESGEEKTFDISYDTLSIPGETQPFAVDSGAGDAPTVAGMTLTPTCYCFVSGNERTRKLKQEAQEKLLDFLGKYKVTDPMPEDGEALYLNKTSNWDPGIFTSTYIERANETIESKGVHPDYVVCFVTHPFRHAVKELRSTFLVIGAIWFGVNSALVASLIFLRMKRETDRDKIK